MQASVEAERSQTRERVAEVLRQPPRRLPHAERPDWPRSGIQDRKSGGWRKRRPKTEQAGNSGAPAASSPDSPAAIAKNAAPVNSAPSGTVSAAPAALKSVLTETETPAEAAVDLAPAPVGAPSAQDLPPGHPSGPSAAQSTQFARAATPAAQSAGTGGPAAPAEPAAPAAPAAPGRPGRSGVARAVLVVTAMAVVVAGASVGVIMAMSGGGASHASHTATGTASATTSQEAAAWVTGQVSPGTTVSCDQAMCATLEAHGYPASNVRTLASSTALKRSGLVVVTPAARQLFGSSLVTAWAPAALVVFGSGSSAVSVRIVAPNGASTYQQEARTDQAQRATFGTALSKAPNTTVAGAAAQDLRTGRVDGRLMQAIADAAAGQPVDVVGFGNVGPGAEASVPLRYADLAVSHATGGMPVPAYVQAVRASMTDAPGPTPDRTQLLTLPGGQQVLRVEFLAPSSFGSLNGP